MCSKRFAFAIVCAVVAAAPSPAQQRFTYPADEWPTKRPGEVGMDEKTLNDIALSTGGAYVPARTRAYDLGEVYEEHLAKLTRGELAAEMRQRYAERFQWFLLGGIALLWFELWLPKYRRTD